MAAPALTSGLAVLKLLAGATAPLSAGVIARDLDLPRSTTYRLLGVLADGGFVTHFPEDRAYGLGVATFEVGTAFLRQDRLERLGRPVLARLAASTRSTAHLGILLGREVLYLLKEQPPRPVALVTEVGVRLPAHLTASGRALLAAAAGGGVPGHLPRLGGTRVTDRGRSAVGGLAAGAGLG